MLRVSSETPSNTNSAVKAIPAVQYYARELRNANENAPDGQEAQALEKYGLIDLRGGVTRIFSNACNSIRAIRIAVRRHLLYRLTVSGR